MSLVLLVRSALLVPVQDRWDTVRDLREPLFFFQHSLAESGTRISSLIVGPPILTKYERSLVLGTRISQLSNGAPTTIEVDPDEQYSLYQIAQMELERKCIPVRVVRKIQDETHIIDTNQLELVDN